MELELATVDEMIDELRRRELKFVFVGIIPTNRRAVDVTYAIQCASTGEVLWMMRQLRKNCCDGTAPEKPDDEPGEN